MLPASAGSSSLAAPGRANQNNKPAFFDLQIDIMQNWGRPKALFEISKFYVTVVHCSAFRLFHGTGYDAFNDPTFEKQIDNEQRQDGEYGEGVVDGEILHPHGIL